MSRTTAQSNVHLLESRVLSTDATTHIALDEPAVEASAIAEDADIEVSATDRTDEAEEGDCVEAPSDSLALSCDADLRLTWGELDEWLGRS
jgi:hypothetical protein